MKYIVVTGGVVSGLGKGITISSIGRILKSSGVRVTAIKIDPYMNVDAGTMSPFEHGETFVLDDGGETDLDLGNYERFLDITLSAQHNITTGKIYREVIERERRGDYLGKTVQIVPHATDMIISWIKEVAKRPVDGTNNTPDVCLIEVGGTVGDIESMIFLEALRQMKFLLPPNDMIVIHLSLVPVLGVVGEQKTKPTQHSVKELRSVGISPDMIICRSSSLLDVSTKNKLSIFCQIHSSHIFSVHDVSNIYYVPLILTDQGIHLLIKQHLGLDDQIMSNKPNFILWNNMANIVDEIESYDSNTSLSPIPVPLHHQEEEQNEIKNENSSNDNFSHSKKLVNIAFVGKYTGLQDSYLSVIKSLKHSSIHLKVKVNIQWIEASDLEPVTSITTTNNDGISEEEQTNLLKEYNDKLNKHEVAWNILKNADGILVPGGFGNRGVEGKIAAAKYARTHNVPYLGLCLGMQVMIIEYARNVVNLTHANSAEFDENTPHPVIIFMPEINQNMMGGTMRLGSRPTVIHNYYPKITTTTTTNEIINNESGNNSSSPISSPASTLKKQISIDTSSLKTLSSEVYATNLSSNNEISERHRHRYEVNPLYIDRIQSHGLYFTGVDTKFERMEIAELCRDVHPFYFGTQYHPEFKSRPNRPSPPVYAFVAVAAGLSHQLGYAGEMWQSQILDNEKNITIDILPPTPFRQYASKMTSRTESFSDGSNSGNNELQQQSQPTLTKKRSIRAISE